MAKRTVKYNLIPAGDLSGNITSDAFNIEYLDNISVIIATDGSSNANGTFAVQVSNNFDPRFPSQAVWGTLTLSSVPTLSGSPATLAIGLTFVQYQVMRIVYTSSSGTGTVNAYLYAKEIE